MMAIFPAKSSPREWLRGVRIPGARIAILLAVTAIGGCLPPAGRTGVSPARLRADSLARVAIANERSINPATFPARSVAVAPFTVTARDTSLAPLGWGLADLLTADLARSRTLVVVERMQIDALLRELRLAASGRVDSASAPQVGKLVGARQLVTGSIAQTAGTRLDIRSGLADVTSGALRAPEQSSIDLNAIFDAEKALAFSLFQRLGVTLTPAERAAIEQRPTRNVAALLAYSRGVRDEALGNYDRAASQYRDAIRLDPGFSHARTKLQTVERDLGASGATSEATQAQLRRATALAGESINRSQLPQTSDAADPSFRSSAEQLVTIIIRITIP
jgi:TolB-like protein